MDLAIIHPTPNDIIVVRQTIALHVRKELSLDEEFHRNPEAVFNRLDRQGRYDELEDLIETL